MIMNTTPQLQSPFVPVSPPQPAPAAPTPRVRKPRTSSTAPAADPPERRASRPRRAKKARAVPAATAAPVPTKRPRKARVAKKAATPRASTGKLDINSIVSATVGLKADEAKMLLSIVGKLGDLGKPGKTKVIGALGKLFG
jgi:hypothetical protein